MAEKDITLEAIGEFPFTFHIEKAVATDEDDQLIIEGIASTTNIDHDNERMSYDALRDMESAINEKSVPLRVEHSKEDSAIIGNVFKAWVDERNQLHIRASLDKSHPVSSILHHSMKSGVKMGLSVGGIVKRAVKEYADSVGKMVKTFYDVALSEVSVTPRPANYDAYVVAKGIAKNEVEAEQFRDTAVYSDFLFQNPQLDYLRVFAKSVPDKAWRKSVGSPEFNNNNKKDMAKKEEMDEKETDKSVTRGEFDALKSMIAKGFESVVGLVSKAMNSDAMDTANPDKKKDVNVGDEAKKAAGDAEDQADPKKDKKKEPGDEAKKSEDDKEDEKEKTSKKEDESDDYKLEEVERSIETMNSLTKRLTGTKKAADDKEDDKKEKSEDKKDDEEKEKSEDKEDEKEKSSKDEDEEKEKTIHPLDQFVAAVTKTMEAMVDKMEKSGKTIPGFQKSFVEAIKNDPVMQEEIAKMAKVPGRKQSVVYGTPMMVTKDGKRFALSATEVGATIEKSSDSKKAKSFKEVYQSEFSSVKSQEE